MLTDFELSQLDIRIGNLRADIAYNEQRKIQKETFEDRLIQLEELRKEILSAESDYKESIRFCIKYQNDKRLKDFEVIRDSLKTASLLVETKGHPRIELYTPPDRIRPETILMVVKNGKKYPLELREGTGIGEGAASMTLLSALWATSFAKVFLWDEMFSSVSPSNTQRISKNLNALVDGKFQLILIEQKNEIVQYTNYREFQIVNDGVSSTVVTVDHIVEDNEEISSIEYLNNSESSFLENGLILEADVEDQED